MQKSQVYAIIEWEIFINTSDYINVNALAIYRVPLSYYKIVYKYRAAATAEKIKAPTDIYSRAFAQIKLVTEFTHTNATSNKPSQNSPEV